MAMADAMRQSDPVPAMKPPINFLNMDKIKHEGSAYNQRLPISAALNMPAPSLTSLSNIYSGPPPPYSYPSSTASSVIGFGGFTSPIELRPTSEEDKEPPPANRHSLPSIHEALASEQHMSITSLLSKPVTSQTSQPNTNHSPTTAIPRSYPESVSRGPLSSINQQSANVFHSHEALDKSARPHYSPRASIDLVPSRFPTANSNENHYPALQPSRTAPNPMDPTRAISQPTANHQPSPVYERFQRPAPAPNPYPPVGSYQAPYSYPPSTASIPSHQHPPIQPPHWRSNGSEIDRAAEVRRAAAKGSPLAGQAYGESVKRHLDNFDLETSLNEIAAGSRAAMDFASNYGIRAHQTQRSGATSENLPRIDECDEMIARQTLVLDSVNRIRDVIIAKTLADAEQQNQDRRNKAPLEYDDDSSSFQDKLEGSGGFGGPDPKKRRGVRKPTPGMSTLAKYQQRAAPPGRCHSCNRAETPEWRRGPDGARTLCNACGLHYAKLTRKMGGSKASSSTSNIRPKDITASSPQ